MVQYWPTVQQTNLWHFLWCSIGPRSSRDWPREASSAAGTCQPGFKRAAQPECSIHIAALFMVVLWL